MTLRNKERNDDRTVPSRSGKRRQDFKVVVHVHPMDEQQACRLTTAVDALLAELVRQEMGRAKSS